MSQNQFNFITRFQLLSFKVKSYFLIKSFNIIYIQIGCIIYQQSTYIFAI